ncbi:type II toxin-antitoxin system RelE/ParE family toxin [Alkalihalobacterium sp. APHAB7]|uniref:type II toxin-antitoxin system RelE/ParE family toxin n=1 Tax=Alkalihalobacterium sp. APHAB7 TaxID=3402081 RepID=UPI003AADDBDB
MEIKWTSEARNNFKNIESNHYSKSETKEYKKCLAVKISNKIVTMMEIMPVKEPEWKGNYMIYVDNYKVIYSFSNDKQICYIKAFKHQKQN